MLSMLDTIARLQGEYANSKPAEEKKKLGQFFTGAEVASYMASLVSVPGRKKVRVLDAGAGAGILSAACVMRCVELGCREIHVVLYEIDVTANFYIEQTMELLAGLCDGSAIFTYEIRNEDFVLARPDKDLFGRIGQFDVSIINPPYFKYNVKTSPYRKATRDLYSGNPNIYASFMAVVLSCLKDDGQMVVIAPRSFTNGLYFKGFRLYLNKVSSLEHIHIFGSRNRVFRESGVLQENIICKYMRKPQSTTIEISSSACDIDIRGSIPATYPRELIIDSSNREQIIRIPDSQNEAKILLRAQQFETTFSGAGYFISTGPVVGFRTRKYISSEASANNSVPLIRPHNVRVLDAVWTGKHGKDVRFELKDNYHKHLVANDGYVLLKRFSSKDEKRRLVAAVHNPRETQGELIGLDNKINYVGVKDESLSLVEAYGLAALFDSTFMDKYFRCLSGNTQVNATEIRVLQFPSRKSIKAIGRKIIKRKRHNQTTIDEAVNTVLSIYCMGNRSMDCG